VGGSPRQLYIGDPSRAGPVPWQIFLKLFMTRIVPLVGDEPSWTESQHGEQHGQTVAIKGNEPVNDPAQQHEEDMTAMP